MPGEGEPSSAWRGWSTKLSEFPSLSCEIERFYVFVRGANTLFIHLVLDTERNAKLYKTQLPHEAPSVTCTCLCERGKKTSMALKPLLRILVRRSSCLSLLLPQFPTHYVLSWLSICFWCPVSVNTLNWERWGLLDGQKQSCLTKGVKTQLARDPEQGGRERVEGREPEKLEAN